MNNDKKAGIRKRIAFLGGGAYTIRNYRLLLEKLANDYDITVYFEFPYKPALQHNFQVRIIPPGIKHRRIRELVFTWMIIRDHFRCRFDLVHSHSTFPSGFYGFILARIFRIPFIVSLDAAEASGVPQIKFGDALHPKRRKINKWIIQRADVVIALTEFLKNEVVKNFEITREIIVLPRGIDTTRFNAADRPVNKPLRILNVAYLHPVKDHNTLLKTVSILRENIDCQLTHIGEDFSDGQIHNRVEELNLSNVVSFKGLVPYEHLHEYFKSADILLHTSLYESQAVVVSEAMACHVLVCGTHVGLMADLSGVCCLTVPIEDADALARVVLQILQDETEMRRLKENGYRWVRGHDLNWTYNRHKEIYAGLGI